MSDATKAIAQHYAYIHDFMPALAVFIAWRR